MVVRGAFPNWVSLSISLFSARPIYFFRIFLHRNDIKFKLLRESTTYFGYNPRRCFAASLSTKRLESKKRDVLWKFDLIAKDMGRIFQALNLNELDANAISHTIFQISPADELRQLETCNWDLVSQWAFNSLLDKCESYEAHATAQFYRQLSGIPWAASFRGHLFERQVLNHLSGLHTPHTFSIRRLTDSNQMTWTYPGINGTRFDNMNVIGIIKAAVENHTSLHLLPLDPNFPAVDSIVYDTNEQRLTCIQITFKSKHPIAVKCLKRIQRWLNPSTDPIGELRPSEANPWRFVFIVPPNMASAFTSQVLEGDGTRRDWAGKVEQYVLGLDVGHMIGAQQ